MANPTERPNAPLAHANEQEHRRLIAQRANIGLPKDGSQPATEPIVLKSSTVSGLPSASNWEAAIIYVSDETGGSVLAFSDGTNWRRVTDRAIVS